MLVRAVLFAALVVLAGCTSGGATPPDTEESKYQASLDAWKNAHFAEGRAIYQRSCASCHDPGASDAPVIGDQKDWDKRSRLWSAVLFEHAKSGYLDMPAKGGATLLSEKEVGAAAEYMLTVTYPDLPVD